MMRSTQSYHTHALVPTERRSPGPPEVPTFQKAGIKGLVIAGRHGGRDRHPPQLPLSYANFNGMQIRGL